MISYPKYNTNNTVLKPLFNKNCRLRFNSYILVLLGFIYSGDISAQTITGAWKGKLGTVKTELKLIKKGDSLLGTSYYYTSKTKYRRYAVRGYFDPETNSVIWWDDVLLEEKGINLLSSNREPFLSVADFNCPGENTMLLEGSTTEKDNKDKPAGPAAMQKTARSQFSDEWDFVLDNYLVGANHPDIIDSVAGIAFRPATIPQGFEVAMEPLLAATSPQLSVQPDPAPQPKTAAVKPISPGGIAAGSATMPMAPGIEEKFAKRTNKLQTVIPIKSEKIELRFYDNAQIDGDSIALFLNGKLLFKNIRLTDQPYTVILDANELQEDNELVMVAENLGSIPPNTSFMVAIVGSKRYEARLYATENSSALIRFIKQ